MLLTMVILLVYFANWYLPNHLVYIQKDSYAFSLHPLHLSKDKTYWLQLYLHDHNQKPTDFTERMRLYLLLDIEFSQISDLEPSVRVIRWIINYGHTHLLYNLWTLWSREEDAPHSMLIHFGSTYLSISSTISKVLL
jgi:hypothetical protein